MTEDSPGPCRQSRQSRHESDRSKVDPSTFDDMMTPSSISPTLAKFLQVPYYTKMNEEDIVLAIWDYILTNKLFIDNRTLLVDRALQPVFHPPFCYKGYCEFENLLIMVFIAKMHTDPDFIEKDVAYHMEHIRRNFAATKLQNWYRNCKKRGGGDHEEHIWVTYLATHYGHC